MSNETLLADKRILIVDDEPDVLDTLEETLSMCEVVRASTFDEARQLLESQDFDLAVLDIMGVDGYKLLNIAKRRDISAVMLTAHAFSPESLQKSIKDGAASYLPKEEMPNIASFLIDVLRAQKEQRDPWKRWQSRLTSSFFTKRWGAAWQDRDPEFWKEFWSSKKKGE